MTPARPPSAPLADRLRPSRLDEIAGNPRARNELRAWAGSWSAGKVPARRAVLLSGPPGVGKTTSALALGAEMGWTVVEMNASDARNQGAIEEVAGRASITHPLSGFVGSQGPRRSLILLDEADCLSGRATESARSSAPPTSLRDFLKGRYREVGALNAAWGLPPDGPRHGFSEWEAVPRSPGTASWTRLPAARRDLDEWRALSRPTDTSDRGGLAAIARLVRSTRQPVVLTVNDPRPLTKYSTVFRTGVLHLRFLPLRDAELLGHLAKVARSEKIALGPGVLEAIVARVRGDLRAALNDLDAVSPLPAGPGQIAVLGGRDLEGDLAELVEEALTIPRFYRAAEVRDRVDAPPDDLFPWVEENIAWFAPDAGRREAGLRVLAVADRFLVRARRARVYGLWSYASELLTGGVGLALGDRPGPAGREAAFPRFLGEMGRSRATRGLRDGVAGKAGSHVHVSRASARTWALPFLERLAETPVGRDPSQAEQALALQLAEELELTAEESAFLLGREVGGRRPVEESDPPVVDASESAESEPPPSAPAPKASASAARSRRKVQRNLGDYGR